MSARRFAEDSSVPVDRTRGEIRELLAEWGCSGMGWFDHAAGVRLSRSASARTRRRGVR